MRRASGPLATQLVLLIAFLLLVAAGVVTVVLPELSEDASHGASISAPGGSPKAASPSVDTRSRNED